MLENKKIFILGMARSGYHVAKLLNKNNQILITDQKDQDENKINELKENNINFVKTSEPENLLDASFNLLIRNPGVSLQNPVILKAKSLNIPIVNEMEVAFHYLPKDIKIIGITGSNGKTTTTTMIYEILKKMGRSAVLAGNIGYPLSEVVSKVKPKDILVLEISDHQLYDFKDFKTNISLLLNLCPTHLDFHGSYENYIKAKSKIFLHHTKNDIAILNYQNSDVLRVSDDILSQKIYFNNDQNYIKDNIIYVDGQVLLNTSDIRLTGIHNYENILAAILVLKNFELDIEVLKDYLQNFNGVEHRIEYVCEKDGVKYYNDSKATNPTSTLTALNSFANNVHLILGGMEREQDFHELDESINKVKVIYAIGQVTDKVFAYAKEKNIKCEKCYKLNVAMEKIKVNIQKGDVVLLSPASASWDQYEKFEDRGNEFKMYCTKN